MTLHWCKGWWAYELQVGTLVLQIAHKRVWSGHTMPRAKVWVDPFGKWSRERGIAS